MAKEYIITIKCPHCTEENKFRMKPPRTFGYEHTIVQCWNSEKQTGCKKPMTLNAQVQVWTDATADQKLQKNAKARESAADRMGGA